VAADAGVVTAAGEGGVVGAACECTGGDSGTDSTAEVVAAVSGVGVVGTEGGTTDEDGAAGVVAAGGKRGGVNVGSGRTVGCGDTPVGWGSPTEAVGKLVVGGKWVVGKVWCCGRRRAVGGGESTSGEWVVVGGGDDVSKVVACAAGVLAARWGSDSTSVPVGGNREESRAGDEGSHSRTAKVRCFCWLAAMMRKSQAPVVESHSAILVQNDTEWVSAAWGRLLPYNSAFVGVAAVDEHEALDVDLVEGLRNDGKPLASHA